jgi:hypothetical protein
MDAWIEGTEACVGELEANREKSDAVAELREVPKEQAAVETVRELEDLHGGRHLAVGRRRQPKKRTQGDGGSRKMLAAIRRRMTRRAVHARRKGRSYKGPTVEKRRWKKRIRTMLYEKPLKDERSRRDDGRS